ncbi:hypothetical protein EDB80DRAFT_228926 [Ilyonectria destructans]|nr:hypothetical protein EDB80DRAFT_228926 [Ilyonectria destructans]
MTCLLTLETPGHPTSDVQLIGNFIFVSCKLQQSRSTLNRALRTSEGQSIPPRALLAPFVVLVLFLCSYSRPSTIVNTVLTYSSGWRTMPIVLLHPSANRSGRSRESIRFLPTQSPVYLNQAKMDRYYPLPISGPHHPNPAAVDPVDRAARSSVQTPAPTHPIVPQRNSSGTVVHEKEDTSESVETTGGPDDVQAMSPRRKARILRC